MVSATPGRFVAAIVWVLSLLAAMPGLAASVDIVYSVNALSTPGRYEYRYSVTNVSLATPVSWFSIDFDTVLYDEGTLVVTSGGLSDWSQQILGSVLANPAQYDAYKIVGIGLGLGQSRSGFSVEFTWLGAGAPGSQAFIVYDPGNLAVLDTGVTVSPNAPPPVIDVPEPASGALALLALCGLAASRRRATASSPAR